MCLVFRGLSDVGLLYCPLGRLPFYITASVFIGFKTIVVFISLFHLIMQFVISYSSNNELIDAV